MLAESSNALRMRCSESLSLEAIFRFNGLGQFRHFRHCFWRIITGLKRPNEKIYRFDAPPGSDRSLMLEQNVAHAGFAAMSRSESSAFSAPRDFGLCEAARSNALRDWSSIAAARNASTQSTERPRQSDRCW